jgi:oxygen-independent coproporphyrinogen III oxidase
MANAIEPARQEQTGVGSYFVANYPPFSVWTDVLVGAARDALQSRPGDVPLGLYLHIPFCRKRCHFCYFRVYTDKNAREV